eukprot:326520-Alexandrium_andersonii.AAC.1
MCIRDSRGGHPLAARGDRPQAGPRGTAAGGDGRCPAAQRQRAGRRSPPCCSGRWRAAPHRR